VIKDTKLGKAGFLIKKIIFSNFCFLKNKNPSFQNLFGN